MLLAYGYAARNPVVVVMALAMPGNWHTHYDYLDFPRAQEMPFWPRFLWMGFFPQLVFWVAFTVTAGVLAGTIACVITTRRVRKPKM